MTLSAEITGGTQVFIRAAGRVARMHKRSPNGEQTVDVAAVFEMYEIVRNETAMA